jgi:hypothetical protein
VPGTVDTARLTLRAFVDSDIDAPYEIRGDRVLMANTFWAQSRAAREQGLRGCADGGLRRTDMRDGRSYGAKNIASSAGVG